MRPAVLAAALLAAVFAAGATSASSVARCINVAAAQKVLLMTPKVPAPVREAVQSRQEVGPGGAGVTSAHCRDLVASSATDLLVNVSVGGTIGGIAWVVLRPVGNAWAFVHAGYGKPSAGQQPRHVSAKPGVRRGEILEYQPLYAGNDPNCCPRGEIRRTYRWNGKSFRLVQEQKQTSPAADAGATESARFRTPSGNIVCVYNHSGSLESVRCDMRSGMTPRPPRPRGCNLDHGQGMSLGATGRGRVTCAGDTILGLGGRALPYGTAFRRGRITCASTKTGLSCTNKAGHGFFLSRESWRSF